MNFILILKFLNLLDIFKNFEVKVGFMNKKVSESFVYL